MEGDEHARYKKGVVTIATQNAATPERLLHGSGMYVFETF